MMDYCARESTINDATPVCCEQEMSTSEILKETRKELAETISVLSNIRLSLEGKDSPERKIEEPKSLYDEVLMINRMATDCMGLSHDIFIKLFGNVR